MVIDLINAGAKVDAVDEYNETPLFCAIRQGHVDTVKILLWNGASTNHLNQENKTPLDVIDSTAKNVLDDMAVSCLRLYAQANIPYKEKGNEDKLRRLLTFYSKIQILWNIWELETEKYSSWLQWLPCELLEDNIELLYNSHEVNMMAFFSNAAALYKKENVQSQPGSETSYSLRFAR